MFNVGSFRRLAALPRMLRVIFAGMFFLTAVVVVQAADPAPMTPTGFSDVKLAKIANPTSIAFLRDGRALVIDQSGKVYRWQEGATALTLLKDIGPTLCTKSDAGLLGIVVDPQANADGSEYFYMFFTVRGKGAQLDDQCPRSGNETPDSPFERLSRFTIKDGAVVDGSEVIVLDHIPTRIQDHLGGDMFFAQDGYLYVSTGDGDQPFRANDPDSLRGKILRINPATGDGAPGNPYFNAPGAVQCGKPDNLQYEQGKPCREVYAMGLRHPWRMALKPGTDPNNVEFYINDVGKQTWEEIDRGVAGADYGWDIREGPCAIETVCTPGTLTPPNDPIFWYLHKVDPRPEVKGCTAATGAAFVPPGVWPAQYDNKYLFADYTCGRMWSLEADGPNGYKAVDFVDNIIPGGGSGVSVTAMKFGPAPDPLNPGKTTQALYYMVYNGGGQLRRVMYTGGLNRAPVAVIGANKTFGASPLTVAFSAAGSSDPDADKITYDWDFGDGKTSKGVTGQSIAHTYMLAAGKKTQSFTATLVAKDSTRNASQPVTLRIDVGNTPPTPTIVSPAAATQFKVGQEITLSGSASDAEDGALPDSALTWHVLRHHDQHTHEELFGDPGKGNNITIKTTEPEGLSASKSSYFEIQLGARDSQGLVYTTTQNLLPHLVDLSFTTQPAGMQLVADDTTITGQGTVTSWENYAFNVSTPAQQDANGQWMVFDHWADGAEVHPHAMRRIPAGYWPQHDDDGHAIESTRAIVTPATATSYVAVFKPLLVSVNPTSTQASVKAGAATITLQLNAPIDHAVTVAYATVDGTAKAGVEYTATSGTATFAPGQTTLSVPVPLSTNAGGVGKSFSVVLRDPNGAALSSAASVTVTLDDSAVAAPDARRIYLPLMQ